MIILANFLSLSLYTKLDGRRNDNNLVCTIDIIINACYSIIHVNHPGTGQTPDVQTKHGTRQTPDIQKAWYQKKSGHTDKAWYKSDYGRTDKPWYQTDSGRTNKALCPRSLI